VDAALLYLVGVVVVVIGVAVSIALHEIGHLVPAKLFGVRVGQYMIGFGPTLFSRRRGETEYGVKAIPLGGYISMAGMYPPAKPGGAARTASTGFFQTLVQDARTASAATIGEGDEDRTFYKLPVGKRIIIMLGGPLMNLAIAVTLFAVLLMGFGVPQLSTTVGSVSECVLPASSTRTDCAGAPDAPGAIAGLEAGDRIVAVDGTPIESWEQVTGIIRDSAGQPLDWTIERDGAERDVTVTPALAERPVLDPATGDTTGSEEVGFVGIGAATERVPQDPTTVVPAVATTIEQVAGIIINLPQRLVAVWNAAFGGGEREADGPMSVVGVGRLAGEVASLDAPIVERLSYLVSIVASLNVALFVFNLIPLMPLDGGHVAGALWEAIRRGIARLFKRPDPGPVDTARIVPLTLAVAILLGGMSALLIYADIVNPVQLFG
jgi:membrane-associated protease RseP (regulator of RpoE activity)